MWGVTQALGDLTGTSKQPSRRVELTKPLKDVQNKILRVAEGSVLVWDAQISFEDIDDPRLWNGKLDFVPLQPNRISDALAFISRTKHQNIVFYIQVACGVWASCVSQILSLRDWDTITTFVGIPPTLPWPGPTPATIMPLYDFKDPDVMLFNYWQPDCIPPIIIAHDLASALNPLGKIEPTNVPQPLVKYTKRASTGLLKLFASLGIAVDCFALGPAAKVFGYSLRERLAFEPPASTANRVSFVIIDRGIDLVAPIESATLLDKVQMMANGEKAPTWLHMNKHVEKDYKLDESVPTPSVYIQNLLEGVNTDDVLAKLSKRLELKKQAKLQESPLARLSQALEILSESNGTAYQDVDAVSWATLAAWAAYKEDTMPFLKRRRNVIDAVMRYDTKENAIQRLITALKQNAPMGTTDILLCSILAFSLHGAKDISWDEQRDLKVFLVEGLISKDQSDADKWLLGEALAKDLKASWDNKGETEENHVAQQIRLVVEDKVDDVLSKLMAVKDARKDLRQYKNIHPGKYESVISQFIYDLLDPRKPELLGVKPIASVSISGLLNRGFSSLGLKNRDRPTDNKVIILHFIGGISWREIYDIRKAAKDKEEHQIIIMADIINKPKQVLQSLFCK